MDGCAAATIAAHGPPTSATIAIRRIAASNE
jgi:hypothetical protein